MSIKNTLIVDDSKSARLVLTRMLKSMDLNVDAVASGEEALDYLATHRPDAIFMDHTMPGMTGLQTVKAVRENPELTDIPIAMYTSKEGEAYIEQVQSYGVAGILLKPATTNALKDIMDKLNATTAAMGVKSTATEKEKIASQATIPMPAIQELVRGTTESIIDEILRTQIIPLLDEKLFQAKEEVLENTEKKISDVASKIYDTRFSTLYRHLAQQVGTRIAELRTRIQTLENPEQDIPNLMRDIASQETTRSRETLLKHIDNLENRIKSTITEQAASSTKPNNSTAYILSSLALVASIVAIGLVFFYPR
ncbi:MAG: response regulator [Candidatus Competibacteraceae bacterium]|jgi:CheY-like chemotaxis protein|nr:response regulator [Candidatus Competibacteraceae bacterium]